MRGPIDYIVVSFEGNQFNGEILSEIEKAVATNTIKLVALSLITKGADGSVATISLDEAGITLTFAPTLDDSLIDEQDIAEVAELLEPNTAAGLLIVEHVWAIGLKTAIVNAGGTLVLDGRIHPEAAEALEVTTQEEQ